MGWAHGAIYAAGGPGGRGRSLARARSSQGQQEAGAAGYFNKMKENLIIGSRGSKLARWQSEWVKARLGALYPQLAVSIEIIKTSGDVLKDAPLTVIGGQGVFTKELEEALLSGRIDLAVHSLKALPTILPEKLSIAAITKREDTRDALVMREGSALAEPSLR